MALSVFKKLRNGLARTRANIASTLQGVVSAKEVDEEAIDDLEVSLLTADLGPELTAEVIDAVRAKASAGRLDGAGLVGAVRDTLRRALPDAPLQSARQRVHRLDSAGLPRFDVPKTSLLFENRMVYSPLVYVMEKLG